MGLDAVEIVISVEERFGITISDEEATACVTPGQLVELVRAKVTAGPEGTCTSRQAFHRIRSALVESGALTRGEITPDTAIPIPLAPDDQKAFWESLRARIGAKTWPALWRPRWMRRSIGAATIAAAVTSIAFVAPFHGALVPLPPLLMLWILLRATEPFMRCIPRRFATVRALVPFAESAPCIHWTRAEIAASVKEIICGQIGLREEDYREDLHFIHDLRLD
jgi:acyl carrier protein